MDPLKVARGFGKLLYLFGRYGVPLALAVVLPYSAFKVLNSVNLGSHGGQFRPLVN